ncbi:adenosylhomocysteinase [Fibrobacter sp. UWCM]|uniref:NAD(P)-dependent oxidoreductase n=1 Tax=Fibrobacter sp. UWCM TaxID=1896208 RepID=UPI00091DA497|nr:NAD(P)-dependent oxidoreductase [Fibrobacter sp. UWCM]SHH49745.1 adenosylhomocysteinase [Fibrobacter sp. UWCM]
MIFDEILNDAYEKREYPALSAFFAEWSGTRPFRALRVLVATPVFRNTLLEYRALIAGGADLVVGVAGGMPCDPGIVEVLRGNGIPVIGLQEALEMEARCAESGDCAFDLILDCAGQFSACHPRFGFVELTRSGVQFYEKCEHPVYVADSGIVKRIETCLGTGEGYVRALAQLGYDFCLDSGTDGSLDAGRDTLDSGTDGAPSAGKKFIVFGSGKVGQGIVLQLLRSGADVHVVTDCSRGANPFLDANGVPVTDCNDLDAVASLVRGADFVVTATGVKGALDRPQIVDALLASGAVLANMGVEDEYGPGVPASRVLAEKKPLNFILEEPTHLKYIDASLALHAALGELLLQEGGAVYGKEGAGAKNAGPQDPPSELEQRILSMTMQDGVIGPELCEMLGGLPNESD